MSRYPPIEEYTEYRRGKHLMVAVAEALAQRPAPPDARALTAPVDRRAAHTHIGPALPGRRFSSSEVLARENLSRPRQLITQLAQEIHGRVAMTGVRPSDAVRNLFASPDHQLIQQLKQYNLQGAETAPPKRVPEVPPTPINPADHEGYISRAVNGVSEHIRDTADNNPNHLIATAADEVYRTDGSHSVRNVKRIVTLAATQLGQGSNSHDALTEAVIIAQWEDELAQKQVSSTDHHTGPGAGHPQLRARMLRGEVGPGEQAFLDSRYAADRESRPAFGVEGSRPATIDVQKMLRESFERGIISRAAWMQESSAALLDEAEHRVARIIIDKQATGRKRGDDDTVTVEHQSSNPLHTVIGNLRVIELQPGEEHQPGAELLLLDASEDPTVARIQVKEALGRLDEAGVAVVDAPTDVAKEILDPTDGTPNIILVEVVDFGPRKRLLLQAQPSHDNQADQASQLVHAGA